MEVLPKRTSVVKEEERKMEVVSVEEVDHKTGSEHKQRGGGDSSLKSSSSPNRKYSGLSNQGTMDISSRQSPSNPKASIAINQKDDQLESTKAEMGEVREENERLKTLLARIVKDYQSLQMHFYDIVQQEQSKTPTESTPPSPLPPPLVHAIEDEEPELISLTLGTKSTTRKELDKVNNIASKTRENIEEGLTLGLDCKFEGFSNGANGGPDSTSTDSTDEQKGDEGEGEETGEPWPPSKILKNMRNSGGDHDEVLQQQQTHVKKIRVSVRARCDAPTMHDGCQWRKYGQKIAKGNPCPRAYYRCTVAPACPVRKQVQRCAKDMSILITTYEGTHSHPLPISATAMASTTSAAASMLTSAASSTSSSLHPPPATISSFVNPNFSNINANAALNFNLPTMTNPTNNINPLSLYLPNPTISSSTAGPSHPTITLDLTSTPQFNTTTSSFPRYSTSFNFFSHSTTATNSVTLPLTSSSSSSSWNNGYLSNYYSAHLQPYNKGGAIGLGNKLHQQDSLFYQSYLQKFANPTMTSSGQQQVLTDTVAKAITSDPSFKSALAAAITSYVGGTQSGGGGEEQGGTTGNGCGSGFLIRSGSASGSGSGTNTQQGGLAFLGTKSSASPVENRENLN